MNKDRLRGTLTAVLAFATAGLMLWSAAPASAQVAPIEVISSSIVSEFPSGFRIKVEARGVNEIESIAIRLKIGQQTRGAFDYLCSAGSLAARTGLGCDSINPGLIVDGELFWRTNTASRYIPPGTIITYNFEIEDSEGTRFDTEPQEFIYHDARFEWLEVSNPPVTVAYHSRLVKTRAELILDAIVDTLGVMGPILGAGTEEPIRVTMYNNTREMLEALPPRSQAISRELVTEGQAFTEIGTLLVLGGGRLAAGTASHEVTHILVHRAGDSIFRRVPPWLNEGLAEYGNIDPGFAYDIALDFAINTDRLLPIMYMSTLPGDPEQVIIFYGQGSSIVRYMIGQFGIDKMRSLMGVLKSGTNMDNALQEVYGHSLVDLDNMWRDSVGAARYVPPESGRLVPTPIPQRVILPYSLTPQPGGESIGSRSAEPTSTATSEPAPTAPPEPTSAPEPMAIPTIPLAAAAPTTPPPPAEDTIATGSSCLAPAHGGGGPSDLTAAGLLLGVVGLALRRRSRRDEEEESQGPLA